MWVCRLPVYIGQTKSRRSLRSAAKNRCCPSGGAVQHTGLTDNQTTKGAHYDHQRHGTADRACAGEYPVL